MSGPVQQFLILKDRPDTKHVPTGHRGDTWHCTIVSIFTNPQKEGKDGNQSSGITFSPEGSFCLTLVAIVAAVGSLGVSSVSYMPIIQGKQLIHLGLQLPGPVDVGGNTTAFIEIDET